MTSKPKIAIAILAAGASTRMGRPKQLLPWGDTTILGHALHQAFGSKAQEVYVILGANNELIQTQVNFGSANIQINDRWQEGLGTSIATAAKAAANQNIDGLLIMLADQPQVDSEFLNKLIADFQPNQERIVATGYDGEAGVPVLFDVVYFERLGGLEGDRGAKVVLKECKEQTIIVEPKVQLRDVDTEEGYLGLWGEVFG